MAKLKPTFEEFIQAVKQNFPPEAQITNVEINNLKEVFNKATREQLVEAYRYAQKFAPLTPLTEIYNQLGGDGIYRPTFKERFHTADGRRVEKGTDWKAAEERYYAEKDAKCKEYDAIHGAGAFDKAEEAECKKLHQWFVDLENKTDQRIAQMQEAKTNYSKEDIEWYGKLVKGVTG